METISESKQERVLQIAPHKYRVRFLHEIIEVTDPDIEEPRLVHKAIEVEVADPYDTDKITASIVRCLYSPEHIEELLSSFTKGEEIIEFMRYQNWRKIAKLAASGAFEKAEFAEILQSEIIEVEMPFASTLSGGEFEAMADYTVKAKINTYADVVNNKVKAYLSFITQEHLQQLEASTNVTITYHPGVDFDV